MNGPDHYREAERLLRLAGTEPGWAVLAQVHATLALAAATVVQTASIGRAADLAASLADNAWYKAVGEAS